MKKTLLTLLVLSVSIVLHSQNENPFKEFGYDVLVATSSKGEFEEFHDQTDIVEIGSVLFNRHTNEIVKVLDKGETTIHISSAITAMSIDPHCEKYYWISPYVYCANNPIKFIDPDGRDLVITGSQSDDALKQLQAKAGDVMTLSMKDGKVSYSLNTDKKLKGDAQRLATLIDDGSITVNLKTIAGDKTSTGNFFVGGAFMGNDVTVNADGSVTVQAFQEVNPSVLARADDHTQTPGKMMMHEVTEAYEGGKISQKAKVSSPNSGTEGSVYEKAHSKATKQSGVEQRMYDYKGNEVFNASQATKVTYSVSRRGKSKVFLTKQAPFF